MNNNVALNMQDPSNSSDGGNSEITLPTVTNIKSTEYKIENIHVEDKPTSPYQKEDSTYEKLLKEYSDSRTELKKMLKDIEDCKNSVLKSVSDSSDYRNKYAREERLKTLSTFFGNMLQVRQEYNKTIQTEIEIRRKLDMKDDGEIDLDIRSIAKQISNLNK